MLWYIAISCMVVSIVSFYKLKVTDDDWWLWGLLTPFIVWILLPVVYTGKKNEIVSLKTIDKQRKLVYIIERSKVEKSKLKMYYHRLKTEEDELKSMKRKRSKRIDSFNFWFTVNW